MDLLFIKALNTSISASWLVLMVMVLRVLLKKSPKWIHVALWALVAVRLICPFSIESAFSLVPSTQTVPEEVFYMEPIQHTQNVTLEIVQPRPNVEPVDMEIDQTVGVVQTWELKWSLVWPVGVAVMLLWALISYFRLKRKVDASIDVGNGVYICDYIDTPFILGIIRPKIYLPSSMEPDSAAHVLAHERSHIARKDHWWKPFGYLLLSIYWFNPLLWLAYILLCRDIELACDEKVIRDMALPQKKAYSEALLSCSVNRRHVAACPLAFGEVGVKERVKTVLNYKKPAFWIVLVAVLALIVTAICFLTDPVKKADSTYRVEEVAYRNPVLSYYMTEENAPLFQITGDNGLRVWEQDKEWADLGEFFQIRLSDVKFDTLFVELEQGQSREENREARLLYVTPREESNGVKFYLLWQENGEHYMAEGITFPGVYPSDEDVWDSTHTVNWLYRLSDGDAEPEYGESPYTWTSMVDSQDIGKAWARPYGDSTYFTTIEGSRLEELIRLLNGVREEEILVRNPVAVDDPLWNHDGAHITMSDGDGMPVTIRYAGDTVIIGTDTDSDAWKTDGYWVIENDALKKWMHSISLGGTDMLSDANRAEIGQLLGREDVCFFDPKTYDDLLFVGCAYDNGRELSVAVFEKVAYGYKLVVLLRDEDVKQCVSGEKLYYCDYIQYRIFLVMNESITGMEWAGAYEAAYAIDTHPGLIVEHFPRNLGSMYRFRYGGGAATMFMDWENRTHSQVPNYTADVFANPGDPHSVCANLRTDHVDLIWATEMVDVDEGNHQAHTTDLNADETLQLLNRLHNLTEDDFEASDDPAEDFRYLDIFMHNYTGQQCITPTLRFKLYENALYCQLLPESLGNGKIWRINAPELLEYMGGFFVEDKSDWHRFAPIPKIEGEVSCDFDGMEVYVPKLAAFEYTVTEEGIRFKPEKEEGYILVRYCPMPFDYSHMDYRIFSSIYGGAPGVRAYAGTEEIWSFMEMMVINPVWYVPKPDVDNMPSMNVRFVNEDKASWVEAYRDQISYIITGMRIHVNG